MHCGYLCLCFMFVSRATLSLSSTTNKPQERRTTMHSRYKILTYVPHSCTTLFTCHILDPRPTAPLIHVSQPAPITQFTHYNHYTSHLMHHLAHSSHSPLTYHIPAATTPPTYTTPPPTKTRTLHPSSFTYCTSHYYTPHVPHPSRTSTAITHCMYYCSEFSYPFCITYIYTVAIRV